MRPDATRAAAHAAALISFAAAHQRHDARAELLHADDEIVERHHHALHAGHGRQARPACARPWHRNRPARPGWSAACRCPACGACSACEYGSGAGIVLGLRVAPGQRLDIGAGLVVLPFRHRRRVGFVGDDHGQHQRAALASGLLVSPPPAGRRWARPRVGALHPAAGAEIVVGVLRGVARAVVALRGADDRDLRRRHRQAAAIVHLEEVAFEVGSPGSPQLLHDGDVFGAIIVAAPVVLGARPDAHLRVFAPLPAGDDVHAEPAMRDRVDRHRHARGDRRRHRQHRAGGEQLDARRSPTPGPPSA